MGFSRILQMSRAALARLAKQSKGSVAMTFGIAGSVLLAAGGMALDYGIASMERNKLQSAVDAAALAAARELQVSNTTKAQVVSVATQTLEANYGGTNSEVTVAVRLADDKTSLTVTADVPVASYFMDWTEGKGVSVKAVAGVHSGDIPLCVLGLSHEKSGQGSGLTLNEYAKLTGNGCAVYSNSTKKDSIQSNSGALLEAGLICSAGGTAGDVDNFNPAPVTDCPTFKDPLQNRAEPTVGSCDYENFQIGFDEYLNVSERVVKDDIQYETSDETGDYGGNGKRRFQETEEVSQDTSHYDRSEVTIEPGVYCGGLTIGAGIIATFAPGDYVIKDGPLYVTQEAEVTGDSVGFFFSGKDSNLYFGPHTKISLSAPTDGKMAGLLFFDERSVAKARPHAILSDGARKLEGTIYLPAGHLYIDADAPIADKSAYTAIIVSRLELFAGPHLVLNTDYSATDVPVPEGVGNVSGEVFLSK